MSTQIICRRFPKSTVASGTPPGEIVPGISGENTSWRMGTGRLARSLRLENVTRRRRSCQFGRAVRGRRDQIGSSGAQSPH